MRFKDRIIGILAAPGYDDFQVLAIARLLRDRDAEVLIIGVGEGSHLAVYGQSGSLLKPDVSLDSITSSELDALIIPVRSSQDELIADEGVLTLLIGLNAQDKPVGAIGNGQLALASAGLLEGRRVTIDTKAGGKLEESGAMLIDQDLVVDRNIVSARTGESLKHFVDVIAFLLEPAPSIT
jgi:protease I